MNTQDFFTVLTTATKAADVAAALAAFETAHAGEVGWEPVGRGNNSGTIEASADPGRALIERLTNGIDAVLEAEHERHGGKPDCRSPQEAANAWLGVPEGGLSQMSQRQRQALAQRVSIQMLEGEDKSSRVVTVRDQGIGLTPERMPTTILSLGAENKMTKLYVAGAYGQGGSATFVVSRFTVIASRYDAHASVGFTVVEYLSLPADEAKIGHYVYLTLNGAIPAVEVSQETFPTGTLARHYGYDLSGYPGNRGPTSVYGLLQRALFDPVMPIWLDNQVHNYRRTIKGARNALNGAVDEGDENARGPELSHNVPMFFSSLGDWGRIGIEYWVLQGSSSNKTPSASFVDPGRPIVLTRNGQTHAEMSRLLIRRYAELPFLQYRLICHVDCNALSPEAKRQFFVSNREEARRGVVYDLIQQEVIRALRSDDDLVRLNAEAKARGQQQEDEGAMQQMRSEVARLLRMQGVPVVEGLTATVSKDGERPDRPTTPRGPRAPRPPKPPIEVREPPTYIRVVWDDADPITLYKGQRRYIRLETDANSTYFSATKPDTSRINIIVTTPSVSIAGATPLTGGRMRAIVQTSATPDVGAQGVFRVELSRAGMPTLADERPLTIVAPPVAKPKTNELTLPPFKVEPVNGPAAERWGELGWPDDIETVAASANMEGGTLYVYYSTVYPQYASQLKKFEQQDPVLGKSFDARYRIWLAIHALLKEEDDKDAAEAAAAAGERSEDAADELTEQHDRQERCRMATLSALFAAREVKEGAAMLAASD